MTEGSDFDVDKLREWALRDTREPLTGLIQTIEPLYGSYAQLQNGQALFAIEKYLRIVLRPVASDNGIIAAIYSGNLALSLLRGISTSDQIPHPSSIWRLKEEVPKLRSLQVFFADYKHPEAAQALDILIREIGEFYPPVLGPAPPTSLETLSDSEDGPRLAP